MVYTKSVLPERSTHAQDTQPRIEYFRRIEIRRAEAAQHMRRFRQVGIIRLALLAIEAVLFWRTFEGLSRWWLLPPAALFLILAKVQSSINAGLAARVAIGLVTTHDLVLARIADELAPRATNVHFEDHLENGRITFDYLLRPGVVQRSNALELMRSVGLEV